MTKTTIRRMLAIAAMLMMVCSVSLADVGNLNRRKEKKSDKSEYRERVGEKKQKSTTTYKRPDRRKQQAKESNHEEKELTTGQLLMCAGIPVAVFVLLYFLLFRLPKKRKGQPKGKKKGGKGKSPSDRAKKVLPQLDEKALLAAARKEFERQQKAEDEEPEKDYAERALLTKEPNATLREVRKREGGYEAEVAIAASMRQCLVGKDGRILAGEGNPQYKENYLVAMDLADGADPATGWKYAYCKRLSNNAKNTPSNLSLAKEVLREDPQFSEVEFTKWAKEVFVTLQKAWSARDWQPIRPFESETLFAQHNMQLEEYIRNGQTNKVEDIEVKKCTLTQHRTEGTNEVLTVALTAEMRDYVVDAAGTVIEGEKEKRWTMRYRLTFIRKAGVKTVPGHSNMSTKNCPNCGAPIKVSAAGECEYCHSIITNGEHGWVLNSLDPA